MMLVLILGFVVDGSRLMAIQGELQNATDACALAAAAELNGRSDAALRAKAAGIATTALNKKNFQSESVDILASDVKFSSSGHNGPYVSVGSTSSINYRFVTCKATHSSWVSYFMSLIGFDVVPDATSYAGLQQTRKACILPLALNQSVYSSTTASSVIWSNLRFADFPDDGASPVTTVDYKDLISNYGTCGVLTNVNTNISVGVAGDAEIKIALNLRYVNDQTLMAGAVKSNRQLIVVPIVEPSPSDTTVAKIKDWACLEKGAGDSIVYQGSAVIKSSLPTLPKSPCIVSGIAGITKIGGISADGPFAPVLVMK